MKNCPSFLLALTVWVLNQRAAKIKLKKNLQVLRFANLNLNKNVFDQPIGTFVYFFVCYENFAVYHNKKASSRRSLMSLCYKIICSCLSCAYIELWMHSGSLESTEKARVALGYHVQLLRIFRALQTSRVHP